MEPLNVEWNIVYGSDWVLLINALWSTRHRYLRCPQTLSGKSCSLKMFCCKKRLWQESTWKIDSNKIGTLDSSKWTCYCRGSIEQWINSRLWSDSTRYRDPENAIRDLWKNETSKTQRGFKKKFFYLLNLYISWGVAGSYSSLESSIIKRLWWLVTFRKNSSSDPGETSTCIVNVCV